MKLVLFTTLFLLQFNQAWAQYTYECHPGRNESHIGIAGEHMLVIRFNNKKMDVYLPSYDQTMSGRIDPNYNPQTFVDYTRYRYFEDWTIASGYKVQILVNKYLSRGSEWGIARFTVVGRKYVSSELKCTRVR